MDAKMGPIALASAPKDRKMPKMVPFWSGGPYVDTSVVMQDTTIAVAEIKQQ